MRYFITFTYDGAPYHGSQSQPNGHTVQAELEQAMSTIMRVPVVLTFAGRTDAGVHAEHMVAHFDADELPVNFASRLNNLLPPSIAITALQQVKEDAHARFDAIRRSYHYRIISYKDPFLFNTHTRVQPDLDFDAMNAAAQLLLGTHDFASFCRTHTDVKTTICTIYEAKWVGGTKGVFVITANRFLRNMVRAVVGTLFEVGRGRMSIEQFAAVIDAHDRTQAGHSAPAQGLSLVDIVYPDTIFLQTLY